MRRTSDRLSCSRSISPGRSGRRSASRAAGPGTSTCRKAARRKGLKAEAGSEADARAAAVESVRDVEVDLHERRDEENAGASALAPARLAETFVEVGDLRAVREHFD